MILDTFHALKNDTRLLEKVQINTSTLLLMNFKIIIMPLMKFLD